MAPSKHERTDSVRRICDLMAAMNDRLTAFGNQLIESHIRLRELLAELRDGTYAGVDLATHCLTFCAVLTDHHAAEDGEGFPVLARHFPELRDVLAELSHDHRQVAEVLDRLKAVRSMDVETAGRELDTLAALLETHLVYEEKKLVAALNRLTPGNEEAKALARAVTLSREAEEP
jgi:iron-sulfur cluster repair protein YtfE (RIC family)